MNLVRVARVITALVVVAGLGAALVPVVNDVLNRHVLSVRVAGNFDHVSRRELESVVREQVEAAGFFAVDVESIRRAAVSLPWVKDATVRRVWPDSVHIAVAERAAVVRWNDDTLLEDDASIFKPRSGIEEFALPRLTGPDAQHAQVLEQFKRLSTGLGAIGGGVVGLSLSERGQWEVGFGNGMTVIPSTPFDVAALMMFARMLPSILGSDMRRVLRVDLRYANGFAVRWREIDGVASVEKDARVRIQSAVHSRGGKG